ncbi:MAG: membrane-associated protein [Parcubacteria group bacterium Gr01-1014_44]|nr:MAG: membrane-associated protein [Parcubacteria group bacterium Gr01-1014_44]
MENLLIFIQNHAPVLIDHTYRFLFLGGLIEGMNTLVLGGFIASTGQVKLHLLIPLLVIAHTLNGYGWYLVGYLGGAKALDKWGHKNKISHQVINKIEDYFKRYSGRTIMFAKFTFSLEIATMILCGSLKYNLKKFSKYNFYGSAGWVFMTTLVGYFFGQSFKLIFNVLKSFTLLMLFLAAAIILIYILKILLKKYFVSYLTIQEKLKEWTDRIRDGFDDLLSNGKD